MTDDFLFLADGVALGAAVMLNHSSLTIIVFVAIMLHKVSHLFCFWQTLNVVQT